jgi:hypothetical protein
MAFTGHLRKQHADLAARIAGLAALLDAPSQPAPAEIRRQISALAEKLVAHLALEDDILYPLLAQHGDGTVRALGAQFIAEMAGVRPRFEGFNARWSEAAIGADPAGFGAEARVLLNLIDNRILRENRDLYPVADTAALAASLCAAAPGKTA